MSISPRILIVDDEERFRQTMAKLLSVRSLQAETARGGIEALEKLSAGNFDIVILDVKMPGMSGIQALEQIKKSNPFIEVIILTGYASLDTAREITRLGAYDYLLKPYNLEELIEKIDNAFDRKISRIKLTGASPHQD
jgi:DNA-binding NtrC family response regulator